MFDQGRPAVPRSMYGGQAVHSNDARSNRGRCWESCKKRGNRSCCIKYTFRKEETCQGMITDYRVGHPGPFYVIPFPRNLRFTGRTAILKVLEEKLFGQQPSERTALVGLGGVGKTQVALQFAYNVIESRPDYSIFWVPAVSRNSLEQACVEMAQKMDLRMTGEEKDIKTLVFQYLSSGQAGRWLMIMDNMDDRDLLFEIQEFLPRSAQGSILLTTRSSQVAIDFAQSGIIDVEAMSHDEALLFIATYFGKRPVSQDDKIVGELLAQLDYLPLAIAQAVAYLSQTNTSVEKYLRLLRAENDATRLLGRHFEANARYTSSRNTIMTTWQVSFDRIENSSSDAVNVLSFLSCIEPKAIPLSILPGDSEPELEDAIGTLCGYSFLVRRGHSDIFDMHRLVHIAMYDWIKKIGRKEEALRDAVRHLARIFSSSDRTHRGRLRGYLPHALSVLEKSWGYQTKEWADLYMDVGRCLVQGGLFGQAIRCFEAAYDYRKRFLPEDQSLLTSAHELASAYLDDGHIEQSIEVFEHVVSVRKTALAEEDESRLASEHELARAYLANNQIHAAIQIFKHVLSVRKRALAKEEHLRLASEQQTRRPYHDTPTHNTFALHNAQDKLQQANDLYLQALRQKDKLDSLTDYRDKLRLMHGKDIDLINCSSDIEEDVDEDTDISDVESVLSILSETSSRSSVSTQRGIHDTTIEVDYSTHMESIHSIVSKDASQSSLQPRPEMFLAARELADLLLDIEELNTLLTAAYSKVGQDRFERNIRRLLKSWGNTLRTTASEELQHQVARVVKMSAKLTAIELGKKMIFGPNSQPSQHLSQLERARRLNEWIESFDVFTPPNADLRRSKIRKSDNDNDPVAVKRSSGDVVEDDSDNSDDSMMDGGEEENVSLEAAKGFLRKPEAFLEFRNDLQRWLDGKATKALAKSPELGKSVVSVSKGEHYYHV